MILLIKSLNIFFVFLMSLSIAVIMYFLVEKEPTPRIRRHLFLLNLFKYQKTFFLMTWCKKMFKPKKKKREKLSLDEILDYIGWKKYITAKQFNLIRMFFSACIFFSYVFINLVYKYKISSLLLGFIFAAVFYIASINILRYLKYKEKNKLITQFVGFIDGVARRIDLGYSLNFAIHSMIALTENPLKRRLKVLYADLNTSISPEEAFYNFARFTEVKEIIEFSNNVLNDSRTGYELGYIFKSHAENIKFALTERARRIIRFAPTLLAILGGIIFLNVSMILFILPQFVKALYESMQIIK